MVTIFTRRVIIADVKSVNDLSKPFLTVLLPTRMRTSLSEKSVKGLLEFANNPQRLHIAVAYDDDDTESDEYFTSSRWKMLVEQTGATQSAHKMERTGWSGLHEYYNHMARSIDSEWYLVWNDDVYMRDQGWDDEIYKHRDYNSLISMESNGKRPDSTLFPCLPRLWIDTFDMIGINPVDQWVQDITYDLGAYKRISSKLFHDHFQFTGNNNDEIYQETSRTKKSTKRAYKTAEVNELKQQWIERWRRTINEN